MLLQAAPVKRSSAEQTCNLQELVEGKSLAQMVEAGWKPSKQEVERIAAELLSSLAYLQQEQVHPAHYP